MPTRASHYRITNGHRAAVCGLVIAGVSLGDSCKIVGVPYAMLRDSLPDGWHRRAWLPYRWRGAEIEELYEDWMDTAQRAESIANRYGISGTRLRQIARTNGFPPRNSKIRRYRRRSVIRHALAVDELESAAQ